MDLCRRAGYELSFVTLPKQTTPQGFPRASAYLQNDLRAHSGSLPSGQMHLQGAHSGQLHRIHVNAAMQQQLLQQHQQQQQICLQMQMQVQMRAHNLHCQQLRLQQRIHILLQMEDDTIKQIGRCREGTAAHTRLFKKQERLRTQRQHSNHCLLRLHTELRQLSHRLEQSKQLAEQQRLQQQQALASMRQKQLEAAQTAALTQTAVIKSSNSKGDAVASTESANAARNDLNVISATAGPRFPERVISPTHRAPSLPTPPTPPPPLQQQVQRQQQLELSPGLSLKNDDQQKQAAAPTRKKRTRPKTKTKAQPKTTRRKSSALLYDQIDVSEEASQSGSGTVLWDPDGDDLLLLPRRPRVAMSDSRHLTVLGVKEHNSLSSAQMDTQCDDDIVPPVLRRSHSSETLDVDKTHINDSKIRYFNGDNDQHKMTKEGKGKHEILSLGGSSFFNYGDATGTTDAARTTFENHMPLALPVRSGTF
ncbi:MAG: hypothetical protein MHM6MM_003274 [Cercozoa sp. M6MM]